MRATAMLVPPGRDDYWLGRFHSVHSSIPFHSGPFHSIPSMTRAPTGDHPDFLAHSLAGRSASIQAGKSAGHAERHDPRVSCPLPLQRISASGPSTAYLEAQMSTAFDHRLSGGRELSDLDQMADIAPRPVAGFLSWNTAAA